MIFKKIITLRKVLSLKKRDDGSMDFIDSRKTHYWCSTYWYHFHYAKASISHIEPYFLTTIKEIGTSYIEFSSK